jgi:4'-phosphopantetheinyl transferase
LVWLVDASAIPIANCWDFLDPQERIRGERCVRHADRIIFVAARSALRCALASVTGVDPKAFRFEAGPWGKPFIVTPAELATLHFSVAHSGSIALITVAPFRHVGIDLERRRRVESWQEIALDVLGQDTTALLKELDEGHRHHAFLRCWTAAEAFAKATGLGLAGFGGRIPLCVRRSEATTIQITAVPTPSSSEWPITEIDVGKDHVGSLVVECTAAKRT